MEKDFIGLEDLLKNPEVQSVTDNINQELIERRKYAPPVCEVLSHQYTVLQDNPYFKFSIDREASKQMPSIIDNKVQNIVAGIMLLQGFLMPQKRLTRKTKYTGSCLDRTGYLKMRLLS
jgi:hypothetical protein